MTTLNRRVYSLADAAEILRISPSTLAWWLEGGRRGKREYPPVIRSEPTGERSLTWAEFVEAGLLRQYRRDLGVRLYEMRAFIASLRGELGVEHPLADAGPWVGEGPRLLMRFQEECGLPADLWLIAHVTGQLVLLPAALSTRSCGASSGRATCPRRGGPTTTPVRRCVAVRDGGSVAPPLAASAPLRSSSTWTVASLRTRWPFSSVSRWRTFAGRSPTRRPGLRRSPRETGHCPLLLRRRCLGTRQGRRRAASRHDLPRRSWRRYSQAPAASVRNIECGRRRCRLDSACRCRRHDCDLPGCAHIATHRRGGSGSPAPSATCRLKQRRRSDCVGAA